MSTPDRSGRRIRCRLVLRDEKDDPSILDIVRQAIKDGLSAPASVTPTPLQEEPSKPEERHSPVDEKLETAAREAIEEALAKVIGEFQATGKEPSFDPAKWTEQLSKVWAIIHRAKAASVDLQITPSDSNPPIEGS
ncbi:MAG TPA: hypothetical protein VG097_18360 [Gemmata sp.]|jgi:hypothetical protein|nr:hypothetical protein [Gemmata sp.]